MTATNAKTAAQDTSTIAYLGDYNSAATAVSLPLINAAGILQVSPASPYVGLTSSLDAGQDEPERFYPSGQRTFGRLQPGDPVQAAAQVQLMRSLGVHSVYVLDDQDPFEMPLATIVAGDADQRPASRWRRTTASRRRRAPRVHGRGRKGRRKRRAGGVLRRRRRRGRGGAVAQLHGADPQLLLLGSSAMLRANRSPRRSARRRRSTYLTTPMLADAACTRPRRSACSRDYRRALRRRSAGRMRCTATRR